MSNIVPFEDDGMGLPAHLRSTFGDQVNGDLSGGISGGYPVLSYKGKTWALSEGDKREVIMRPGTDDEPASALEVVIVAANSALSKVYYEGGYVEGSDAKPVCYSNDSIRPAADAERPQCATCAACPKNAWGSRITENGSKGKACSDSRRIAVVPSGDLEHPMLLRVPAATLKDLKAYADMLTRRNAPYQAVVTKIAFDPTVAHPKFTFKAVRWLNAQEAETVAQTMQLEVVGQITGTSTPRTSAQQTVAQAAPAPAVAETPAQASKPAPAGGTVAGRAKPAPAPSDSGTVKATPAKKTSAFSAPADESKPAPAPSKTASKIMDATAELDAALAELDDV